MVNRLWISCSIKVLLRDIGLMIHAVNQYMVPGLVLWGMALGHVVVPSFAAEKFGVDVDDHAPVAKQFVVHDLS